MQEQMNQTYKNLKKEYDSLLSVYSELKNTHSNSTSEINEVFV